MGQQKIREVLLVASALLCVPIVTSFLLPQPVSFVVGLLFSVFSISLLLAVLLLFDIARRNPADSHTWQTLSHDYARMLTVMVKGRAEYNNMLDILGDCKQQQDVALRRIIDLNKGTVYGEEHGLVDIKNREDFAQKLPLTDYSNYRPYADRIAEGEQNIMTSDQVVFLSTSSGTTGKNKVFPLSLSHLKFVAGFLHGNLYAHWDMYFGAGLVRRLDFKLFYPAKKAPCGLGIGGIGSILFRPYLSNIVPVAYRRLLKETSMFYAQAVFALAEPELGMIETLSSDVVLAWFDYIVANKDQLCSDIETGILTPHDDFDGEILAEHQAHFRCNPSRAEAVRDALSGPLEGLARRVWPRLKALETAKSGSFAHSANILLETYLEGLTMNFYLYGASEGWLGQQVEADAGNVTYTAMPHDNFLEFIHISDAEQDEPKTYFMEQLEVGQMYEIVVTNRIGLYRYRLGDVVEVTGYNKSCPKFVISHRLGQILNVVFERTPETRVLAAVQDVENTLDIRVENFTVTESFNFTKATGVILDKPCYVMFIEVSRDEQLQEQEKTQFEEALQKSHECYGDFRGQESIGPMSVVQVHPGTFTSLRHLLTNPSMQFKMPRVLRKPEALTLLWTSRLNEGQATTFSQKYEEDSTAL